MSTEMSEIQTEKPTTANEHDDACAVPGDEDLEDGEIDDSDEEVDKNTQDPDVGQAIASSDSQKQKNQKPTNCAPTNKTNKGIDADTVPGDSGANQQQSSKSKKSQLNDDDFVGSIEHAIANALKKKGIEPTMPKILEGKLQQQNNENSDESGAPGPGQGQSKSSRRRKRKKQREEKEKEKDKDKEKERSEKRKRYDTSDPLGPPPFGDEMDMDEFEMLNVRGGSPPPLSALPPPHPVRMYDDYDSRDDSPSSYDSYDSNDENSNGERRKRRSKKESRRRKEKRADDKRSEKRSRRDSLDEKHRNEPRKLELCKFYLMECCAKRDKCSYMHAEFPCKYYYLGMECTAKEDCKFSHGEPLSEELRNILLKHLESAPKEILGNFKRMSRENALNMVVKRHEELCRKYNAQNIWAPVTANSLPISNNRRNNNNTNSNNINNNQRKDNDLQLQNTNIPSLLDLVVNPPPNMDQSTVNKSGSNETKRKSRWTDSSNTNTPTNAAGSNSSIQPPSKSAPSYLDLKNLTGILSADHIEKLSQMGIVNLEQVNQLTFGQLNQIGLTIAEITEIQLNAINMAKLGVTGGGGTTKLPPLSQNLLNTLATKGNSSAKGPQDACKTSSNGDVDMRFLPAVSAASASSTAATITTPSTTLELPEKDNTNSSNSNSSSGVVMVDYSQYLKDSNISFDKGDLYDDEKDDEQLVIDDGNLESEEHPQKSSATESVSSETVEKINVQTFDNGFTTKLPRNLSDITKTFRNPFKTGGFYGADTKTTDARDPRSSTSSSGNRKTANSFGEESNEDLYYPKRRRSRESRSRSRTPPVSQSNTPEASQSPQPFDSFVGEASPVKDVVYERSTIYDFSSSDAENDDQRSSRQKSDKDMRFLPGSLMGESSSGDIDLRLPFQPMTNYTPATEIDGSITSHLPIHYKVYVVDVPRPSYAELRQHFKSDQSTDPRLRRILGLSELSPSKTALSRKVRKCSSNSIASPSETEDSSPRYYTPPSSEDKTKAASRGDPRADTRDSKSSDPRVGDPRQSESRSSDPRQSSDPRRTDPRSSNTTNASSTSANSAVSTNPSGGQKQNIEIRNLLQKSEWYKNLNSKFKIMVNQQLALVSTELKKFHQDQSPNKIFDISFIVNNQTLQQILTNLGIFIDDNGEVAHIEGDGDDSTTGSSQLQDVPGNIKSNITLPNLSQPPPNAATNQRNQNNSSMDFLLAPPPNMVPQGPPPMALGPMFQRPSMQVPPFARPSLLGLPPGQGNPMNPFSNPMNVNINPNFLAGAPPGILGPFAGGPNFGPGGNMLMQPQQRNFSNNQRNNNRNQNKRRI